MTAATIAVVVLGLATAINPPGVTIVLLALMSRGGVRKAAAFLAGNTIAILLASGLGLLLGYIAVNATATTRLHGRGVGALEFLVGLVMLGIGLWSLTLGRGNSNSLVERAMNDIDDLRPWFVFGLGLLLVSYTMPLLLMGELLSAQLPQQLAYIALYLLYLLLALTTVLVPILMRLLWPARSEKYLQQARVWLTAHGAALLAWVFIVLGVAFAVRGGAPLLG